MRHVPARPADPSPPGRSLTLIFGIHTHPERRHPTRSPGCLHPARCQSSTAILAPSVARRAHSRRRLDHRPRARRRSDPAITRPVSAGHCYLAPLCSRPASRRTTPLNRRRPAGTPLLSSPASLRFPRCSDPAAYAAHLAGRLPHGTSAAFRRPPARPRGRTLPAACSFIAILPAQFTGPDPPVLFEGSGRRHYLCCRLRHPRLGSTSPRILLAACDRHALRRSLLAELPPDRPMGVIQSPGCCSPLTARIRPLAVHCRSCMPGLTSAFC